MLTKTPKQQTIHLMKTKWIDACQQKAALYEELDRPTASRTDEAQAELVKETKAAGVKCDSLYVVLGAFRKSKAISSEAIVNHD